MELGLNASEAYKAQLRWAVGHFMGITTDSGKKKKKEFRAQFCEQLENK